MIRHICMFTLKEENKEQNIIEFCERAEKLKALEVIKGYDVALIFDFNTVENLDEYQKSELHLEFGDFEASVRVNRACIDFEI